VKVDTLAWNEFCDYFVAGKWLEKAEGKGAKYPTKQVLPLYGLYLLEPGANRGNESVVQLYALSLDFDSGCELTDIEAVFGDWRCAIHTTWSHTTTEPRTRLVLPLSRPVDTKEFGLLIRWAMDFAQSRGLAPDPACKDPARAWFVPCSKHRELYEYVVFYEDDAPALDVDALLSDPAVHNSYAESHVDMEEVTDDTKVFTFDGPVFIQAWGEKSSLGDKVKCSCPDVEDSTIGSAFLRRCKLGVMLVCTSPHHKHKKTPHKKFYPFEGVVLRGEEEGLPEEDVLPYLSMKMKGGEPTGCPSATASNLSYILQHDSRWRGRVWLNEFANNVWYSTTGGDRPWVDEDDTSLSIWLTRVYGTVFSSAIVRETINLHATKHKRNPLREEIESEEWDNVERLEGWLLDGFGVVDSPINRAVSAKWAIQAIARCFKPGCQADATLVLVGHQGVGKSSGLRILGGDYFSDTPLDFGKDSYLQISRAWIYEIAELDAFRGRANSQIKAFLTAAHDNFRAPYKQRAQEVARHVVFAATTNERSILSDSTGARRFWPVKATKVDREYLAENRKQIWAEALVAYRGRHPIHESQWWLTSTEEDLLLGAQEQYQVEDSWQQIIAEFLEKTNEPYYTVPYIMSEGLDIQPHMMDTRKQKRVAETLRRIGLEKKRVYNDKGRRITAWAWPKDRQQEVEDDAYQVG